MSPCNRQIRARDKNEIENLRYLKHIGYSIGRRIGEGTYSRVCVALHEQDGVQKKLACKIVNRKHAEAEFIKRFLPREINIISVINHPNIVAVSNIVEINQIIYIFMDYCKHGDLLEYIRQNGVVSQTKAKIYFRQIVDAVQYLHNRNIAHRDLKCENVFLTDNNKVKLGDFGFARVCIDKLTGSKVFSSTYCGSAAYAAPEILKGVPYDPKMYDIWSMGCILFIMLSAAMPFDDTNLTKMLKSQMNKTACLTSACVWQAKSPSLSDLFSNLLEPDVSKRYTINDVVNCQWLKEITRSPCTKLSMNPVSNTKKSKLMK
ncbi:hypothetical protein RN001_012809 [Aquatica leii]|uniref:Protein kinase domain-containing protein n=1 Tax=Aquatica leii TaxID=1421715 RepID=A0AAN7P4F6_9COLE|nr:hypothetical protein RN001_012809 [Aquatica leii]